MDGLIYARPPSVQKHARTRARIHAHTYACTDIKERERERGGSWRKRERTKRFCVALYCRRRGRRQPIEIFGGWRLFVHRYVVTFLFARPLYMAAHTYGYASIYPGRAIKIPTRADTSGIIRSSKQDCPDDFVPRPSTFVPAPFVGQHPSCRVAPYRAAAASVARPFAG